MFTQDSADQARAGFRIPGRLAWATHGVAAGLVGIFAAMAVATGGVFRAGTVLLVAGGLVLWAAFAWATLPPRASLEPATLGHVRVLRGSRVLAGLIVSSCVLVLAAAATWTVALVRDPYDVPHPGFVLVVALAALGALPTVARLGSGRLHVWRLELDPGGLRCVGGRVDVSLPWSAIRTVRLNEQAARLLIEPVEGAVVAVPMLAFDVPATQVLVAVDRARSTRAG